MYVNTHTGASVPLGAGPHTGRFEYVLSLRGVPAGKRRAAALEAAMLALRRNLGDQVAGFECGEAKSWGRRVEVPVWLSGAPGARMNAERFLGGMLLVEGVELQSRAVRYAPFGVTRIVLWQLPQELCLEGLGECLLAAAGVSNARVVAEFHPAAFSSALAAGGDYSFPDVSRVVVWVEPSPGADVPGAAAPQLGRLPPSFRAGDRTVRVSVGWPQGVEATALPALPCLSYRTGHPFGLPGGPHLEGVHARTTPPCER